MRHPILFLFLLLTAAAQAATYYISPTGNDANNGTSSSTPWRTIDRVNQISFSLVAGDRILFQRGGTYRGKLNINGSGTAASYIEVGAYGTGDQPIISGSVAVTGWTQHSGNIWRAPMTQLVRHIYVDGALQTIARFPNTGWLRVDQATSTSLTDAELTQATGYWNGATAVIRTTNWSYDTARVSAFSNGVLTHTSTGNNLQSQQWGYFLRNKLALLDAPGEWFLDRAAGQLYLWCPNNANPNNVLVEASVMDFGVYVSWQRHHIKIDGLHFKHQHTASIRVSGTSDLEAMNCSFTDVYQAVMSTGNNQSFHHFNILRTYGTAIYLLDNNTSVTHCTLRDVAMVPGLGEKDMGYIGMRLNGAGVTITDNRMENIGYCGIAVANNALVERNVIINAMAILNDGGGITFDHADGVIVRNNIVRDLIGNVESCAPNWINSVPMCHGIYFGNTSIKNALVKDNTVSNCSASGMHVDHTMVSSGNRIEGNVLYNNAIQLSVSDFSNYNGPGATAPYHVPAFNTVYSGNVLYSVTKDQLCMRQYHCNSPNWVDYGTFTNNRYFSPYNDRSIYLFNTNTGTPRYFALERWQATFSEDAGSTRSPLYLPSMEVTSVLGSNPVPNGTFASNVTGWTGWPSQGQLAHNTSRLDNGSLRVSFTSNATYNTHNLKHTTNVPLQQGSWYRLRFSLVSDMMGELTVGFKGLSQLNLPTQEGERVFPFDGNRRDVEHFFQSTITDQGSCQFTCLYTEGIYYLDNVSLERVTAVPVNPFQSHVLLANEQPTAQVFSVPSGCWKDVDGNVQGATVTLQPYTSRVIYRFTGAGCSTAPTDCAGVVGGTAVPGAACNDNNPCTINDVWSADCQCAGTQSTPSATITAGGTTVFCAGGSVTLAANTGTGLTYQWRNNGTAINGATASTYHASTAGSYTVSVTNANGCSATSSAIQVTVNPAPSSTVTASGPTSFCTGSSVTLSAATGTGFAYQWRNNGAAISGATSSTYTATASGSYSVTVTSGGCSATSAGQSVTVSAAPAASITAGGPTTFCAGGTVVLSANTGTGLTYQWRRDGASITGATGSSFTATAAGSYTVTVTSGGCSTTSAAVAVAVNSAPAATITAGGSTGFCSGGSVALNANTGTGLTYQWFRNGSAISGATGVSYTASTAGSYTVRVTSGGCSTTSAAVNVTVGTAPAASITAGGPTTFCSGGSVSLAANTGTGLTYQWRRNGTAISGATASVYAAATAGTYTVTVTNAGCSTTSAGVTVNVTAAPIAAITAGGSTTFCTGGSVTLSASTGTGYTYQWRNNGAAISGATGSTYTATATGAYSVAVSAGGCTTVSASTNVNVSSAPAASITAGGSTSFCAGGSVALSANQGSGFTYQWRRDGSSISGATASTYSATQGGSYTVVVANGGCSSTSSPLAVTVRPVPTVTCSASPSTSTVSVAATGGQSPYAYAWNTSPAQTTPTASVTASGTYAVTVTGANGCSSVCSTTITLSTASCTGIRTETQGIWGLPATATNQSGYMANNWSAAFPAPNHLTIGCSGRLLRFTTAQAVINTLPTTGTAALLPSGTTVDPGTAISNTLLGHLAALKISVRLDELNPSFSSSDVLLKDMIVRSGTFAGWTVQQLVNHADQAIGGCVAQYPLVTIASALANINQGYQGGTMNNNYLRCPGSSAMALEGDWPQEDGAVTEIDGSIHPNPFRESTTITLLGLDTDQRLDVRVLRVDGALVDHLYEGTVPEEGALRLGWQGAGRAAGLYILIATNGDRVFRGKLMVE